MSTIENELNELEDKIDNKSLDYLRNELNNVFNIYKSYRENDSDSDIIEGFYYND